MNWDDWYSHPAFNASLNLKITEWVSFSEMTDDEKRENKSAYITDGYLKTHSYYDAWSNLWKTLSDKQKDSFKTLPNFDADIFEEVTGIRI